MKYKDQWRNRYVEAYNQYQDRAYPAVVKDFGYNNVTWPKVSSANGLTMFVVKFLTYAGWRATRVNTQGRLIKGAERQASGTILVVNKFIPTSGRKGSADVSSTIKGRSVMFEIKIGSDKPSEHQLKEQALEQQAGGFYFFIKNPEQFIECYDLICNLA